MSSMIGKGLMIIGGILFLVGTIMFIAGKMGVKIFPLPGDIIIERKNFTFVFPVATCLVLSGLLTLLIWVISLLKR